MASAEGLKKRRKTEKKAEAIGSDSGSSHNKEPVDWWDEFCRRVNDRGKHGKPDKKVGPCTNSGNVSGLCCRAQNNQFRQEMA
ncbi:hypothetical protein SAY87_013524 [Trapa incisa]|uniref:Uncharacterized protein n=1 Tax=Trapa incisa TaxID=236973 RepID=A0AAN7QD21_9MYRT|nr:hypothetical protein SAY87_013524 [Trapa incisa]